MALPATLSMVLFVILQSQARCARGQRPQRHAHCRDSSSGGTVGERLSAIVRVTHRKGKGHRREENQTLYDYEGPRTLNHGKGTAKKERTNAHHSSIQRAGAEVNSTHPCPALHDALEFKEVANAHHLCHRHSQHQEALGDSPKGYSPAVAVGRPPVASFPRLERLKVHLGSVHHRVKAFHRVDQVRHMLCGRGSKTIWQ